MTMTIDRTKILKIFTWFSVAAVIIVITVIVLPKIKKTPPDYQPSSINHQPVQKTTLFFAGDIMLSRNVADKIYKANDFSLPFQNVKNKISAADISFANLESPFNDTGSHFVPNSLVFNADPKSIEGLIIAGFDILSTANNHALDQGLKGLDFTIQTLMDNGIIPTGTVKTEGEPVLPII